MPASGLDLDRRVWRDRTRKANKVLLLDRAIDQWKGRPLGSIRTGDARAFIAKFSHTYAPSTVGVNFDRVKSVFTASDDDRIRAVMRALWSDASAQGEAIGGA